jgi:hypothetical protein
MTEPPVLLTEGLYRCVEVTCCLPDQVGLSPLGALVASHHIVIPVSAAVWSTTGLRKFVRWINVHQDDEVVGAELLGLVATIVPARTRIGRALLDELQSSEFPTFRRSFLAASGPRMPSWTMRWRGSWVQIPYSARRTSP